ncbi:Ig-like domain-containing protein [Neolewinella agarilytica]|uniref:Por secretion system C-terminal sorting domain-containing protein n=1 Tax=Neolewinella agarilytica TaxID=478744 RepID=A0A1H9KVT2_9BACT|nr:T9SS type A sorting domain-containing protein [Neolewinella agarilytica]SER03331.1 Por secretion system C-terminal sorting domain-containing protein [Neolewinella agarilytica]
MRIIFTLCMSLLFCSLISAQEATRLTDINAGPADASPTRFFNFQGNLLFRARAADTGTELYLSDGTPEGTRLIKDINDDPSVSAGNANPDNFIFFNGKVYFNAQNAASGEELFSTDGTAEGTVLVDDIYPGSDGSDPSGFILLNNELYFTATDENLNAELHRLDMSGDTAALVIDINPGGGAGNPMFNTFFDGNIFFSGDDGTSGQELWSSDGFDSGTFRIADINMGSGDSGPNQFTVHDGGLYFRAGTDEFGRELYRSDGLFVERITDLLPGPANGDPGFMISFGNRLFFTGESVANGRELYVSDGTAEGTIMLEINEGAAGSSPTDFQILDGPGDNDILLFIAEDEDAEQIFFLTIEDDEIEIESMIGLYGDEGTVIPTEPDDVAFTGSTLYFTGNTPENGEELYKLSLINEDGPQRITDIGPGSEDGGIDETTLIGTNLFFEADDSAGKELWVLTAEFAEYELAVEGQGRINNGDTINMGSHNLGVDLITRTFDIVSTGTGPTSASIENINEINDPFAVLPISDLDSIGSGTTANVQIGFLPLAAGTFVDSLEIFVFGRNGPEEVTIYLKGIGIASSGVLDVTVNDATIMALDEINFGEVPSRTDSTIPVVLTNSGAGPLMYSPSLRAGMEFTADDLSDTRIAAGGTDTINLTFRPTTEGAYTDTLDLNVSLNAETMTEVSFVLVGNAIVNSVNNFGIENVKAFPNPTTDQLRIELGESLPKGAVRVFNVSGQQLREEAWPVNARVHDLSIKALPAGAYTLEVSNGNRRVLIEVIKR